PACSQVVRGRSPMRTAPHDAGCPTGIQRGVALPVVRPRAARRRRGPGQRRAALPATPPLLVVATGAPLPGRRCRACGAVIAAWSLRLGHCDFGHCDFGGSARPDSPSAPPLRSVSELPSAWFVPEPSADAWPPCCWPPCCWPPCCESCCCEPSDWLRLMKPC